MTKTETEFHSAGRTFPGVFFEPDAASPSEPRPGVLVLHGGAGLGAHEHERAGMLADLGYLAFAPDLFGEVFTSRARGIEAITGLVSDPQALRRRLTDALAHLRGHSRVDASRLTAIGFCFGGLASLELARSGADLRAVVTFHGGLTTHAPAEPGVVRASILVCTGAADPHVTREHREGFEDEMTRATADWQMHTYSGAMHCFTERGIDRPGAKYDERADGRSWQSMRELFEETVGPRRID
jgi:dienelactone hydrolase